jgi:SAM-dependent methyltransferase
VLTTARAAGVEDLLRCPLTGQPFHRVADAYVSEGVPALRFPVEEDGIVQAFMPDPVATAEVTERMQAFYEAHPFPNYDGMEDIGSLIEKSVERRFPEMLNRSIPPNATVLEVGCGTGQLGNFLSIASRRVLSVDACLVSLRLGQAFKKRHGLGGVTFAQMNLFRLPLRPAAFDVVICTGVLHHTSDPAGGFRGLLPLVKPGGRVVIGLYNRLGRLKTRLRRALAGVLGERIARLDPYLREYPMTPEKQRVWFMDQYRNPHESLHTMDEVLGWFDAVGVRFVRAIPGTVPGRDFSLDYRASLFHEDDRGSFPDRLLSQVEQMLTDREGGLFIMIGRVDGRR